MVRRIRIISAAGRESSAGGSTSSEVAQLKLKSLSRRYVLSLASALTVVAFAASLMSCGSRGGKTLRLGAVLPLTGDAALYGQNARQGLELAVETLNAEGGILGRQLEIEVEDSRADPKTGVAALQKLITLDRVPAVVGDITSSVTLAMAPIAQASAVVIISPAATSPKLSGVSPYVFRNWTSDAYEGFVISRFAKTSLGVKRLAMLVVNNDYGVGLEKVVRREFGDGGHHVVAVERFHQGDLDFLTQITKIRSLKPDALYLVAYPEEYTNILKQAQELGVLARILATSAFQDPQILKNAGAAAEGVVFPYPDVQDPADRVVAQFRSRFRAKYGKEPGIVCDTAYDAVMMIAKAAQTTGAVSGDKIREGLSVLRNFHGASGVMSFNAQGDVEKLMVLKIARGGAFVPFEGRQGEAK